MTHARKPTKPNPHPRQAHNPSFSTTGMKLIVPLQGVVQGRGGLLLGTLVPCALFYFLQLYLKRRRSNFSPPSPSSEPTLPRTSSRSNLSTRGSISRVRLSKLATQISRPDDSLYYVGLERASRDPYHAVNNPHGIIQLGLSDNKLCFDLIGEWVARNLEGTMSGGVDLGINGIAPYQTFDGVMELKMALSDFMHQVMGESVKFDPYNMVLTAGATPAIEILSYCLADHGNAFLVPTPYYPGFDRDVRWRPGVDLIPVHCRSTDNFNLNITALDQAFSQARKRGVKIRGILISNPSNPVGNILTQDMLYSLLDFAEDKNIHIIVDEVYAGSTYGSEKFVSLAEVLDSDIDKSRFHIVYSLSKDLSLAGFRVGVICSFNDSVLAAAKKLTRFSSISAPTQRLVTSMLSDKRFIREYLETNRKRIRQVRDEFVDCLSKLGINCAKSSAGMFCWADMSGLIRPYSEKGEIELWEKFLSIAKISITPGSACHCIEPGWFRICFTTITLEEVPLVIERIRRVVESCNSSS
ncbi:probable aminotransferase ACS12 isoform X1 [Vigna radiata var. radiata]|uniref:1-aminocyclopropane-1-carboxylate synthase n=2 Tax=Vigna radiata var. radiata TaxID=3916 RepID=A0A1S3U542_VIGRR|nr:probable aminotransferase ACS12 isoform X1 [Vigna radiata var. radiata]